MLAPEQAVPQLPSQLLTRVCEPVPHTVLHVPQPPHKLQAYGTPVGHCVSATYCKQDQEINICEPDEQDVVSEEAPLHVPHVPEQDRVRVCAPLPHVVLQLPYPLQFVHDTGVPEEVGGVC